MSEMKHKWSWEVFVACMFIGLGIGQIFDAAGTGVLIGMGVGFILGAFIRVERKISLSIPRSYGSAAMIAIGVVFVLMGLSLLGLFPLEMLRIFGGLCLIALGFALLAIGALSLRRRERD